MPFVFLDLHLMNCKVWATLKQTCAVNLEFLVCNDLGEPNKIKRVFQH